MRKNIKYIIISLSVLAVTATVTAITVPLVMHANNVDDQNLNRDETIKEVALVLNSDPIQRITKSISESEILDIVKSTNETPNGWKDAFKLTNENDKIIKNAIKSVELVITRSPIVDGKQDIQLTFLITYNDGIKFNSQSSIIKHKMPKNIVTSLDLVPDGVAQFTVLVNANLSEIKNNGLQTWLNKAETQGEIAKLLTAKQGETNVPVSLANSEDITPKGSFRYKIKITPMFDGGSQENIIFLSQNIVFPEISLEKIELALEKSTDFEIKKTAATDVLKNELASADTIADKKALYDSWKTETPVAFKEALSELLVVTDKSYNWTDILKEIKITPGTFPETVGLPIPKVSVEIILKDDFSASTTSAGLLKFDITGFGDTTKQVSITNATDHADKLDAATLVLSNALAAAATIDDQKTLYESWSTGANVPAGFEDALKGIVTFDNGGITWDNAFASVALNPGVFTSTIDTIIPQVGITITLKTGYEATTDSKKLLTFNSGDLGKTKATTEVVVANASDHNAKLTAATSILTKALTDAPTLAAQKTLYEGWATPANVPEAFTTALKGIVTFGPENNWNDVVADIAITPGAFTSTIDTIIPQVGITITLKTGYEATTDSKKLLTFNSGDLGKTKATTEVVVADADDHAVKLTAATKVLKDLLAIETTIDAQKTLYESWAMADKIPVGFEDALKGIVTFDGGITWDTIVKGVVIKPSAPFPVTTGVEIPAVTITIELKETYIANSGTEGLLTFDSNTLGKTTKIGVTITNATDHDVKLTAATLVLSDALAAAATIDAQKTLYESWSAADKIPAEFIAALKDIVTFDGGITWETAFKGVKIIPSNSFPVTTGVEIPAVTITIELKETYIANSGTEGLLTFDSNTLGKTTKIGVTITNATDHDVKLTAATLVLSDALAAADTRDAQKTLYESWSTGANVPAGFADALKDIVTFNNGGITWETAFKGVNITPATPFPATGAEIPPVTITIELNETYIANSGTESLLTFKSGDLGKTKKIGVTITNSASYQSKLDAATLVLSKDLVAADTRDAQKTLYESWSTGANVPAGFADALKDIVTFNNGGITWETAFKGVNITPATPFPATGAEIPPVTITIELNETYIANSGTESLLTFKSGDLGNAKIGVTVAKNSASYQSKLDAATNVLKTELNGAKTPTDQKKIYNDWEKANPARFVDALKDIVTFDGDGAKWGTIVKGVKITKSGNIHTLPLTQIPHVIITIELNEKYSATESTKDLLSFDSGDLGQTTKIGVTVAKADGYDTKLTAATSILNNALAGATTIDAQKALYESWATAANIPEAFVTALKDIVTFDGWISWDTTVEVVNIQSSAFPTKPSTQIPAVKITIKLKAGYIANNSTNELLSFDSGDLGLTVNTPPVPLENAEDILIAELKKR